MKKPILLVLASCFLLNLQAQLKTTTICPEFNVNILDGKINEIILPTASVGYIKEKMPCFSSAVAEVATAKCGGGVFYKDKDIYFYTSRDYVEIGPKFKGKLSIPLMGASRNSLFKWLGHAKIKDISWDAFTTSYGTLVLYYTKANKVNKIQFSSLSSEALTLCE